MTDIQAARRAASAGTAIPAFFLYGEPLRTSDERTVHVETIAARSRLHEWKIRPHRHRDLHQVLFLQRGSVVASIDDRSTELRAPAAIIVPPLSVHSFRFQEGTIGWVMSFGIDLAREIASTTHGLLDFLQRPAALPLDRSAIKATDLTPLSQMLLREFSRSAQGRDIALSGLLAAVLANLLRLARNGATDAEGAATREREIVARYRQLIESRYREHAAISAYARELGTSETRLRRACLAVAGQSPVEIVHQRLLVEAERQLRYTSMSVTQIAYFLGFEDPAYFSRFFTRFMRVSPRGFRGRKREE
jgi:AraC family transcriptional activator of pobA